MEQNELPIDPHHLESPLSAAKKISAPMVYLAQTMHLPDTKINTVSKQTEVSYHLSHVNYEFHRVRPK
jgi:hypothetical protein